MATEIIHTIQSSGGDYTSLSAWEAAQQRDLVAQDEIAIAECYAFEDTTPLEILGWTTDDTRYIEVRAAPGAEARLPWSTNAYRLVGASYNAVFDIGERHVRVKNIQAENTRNNPAEGGARAFSNSILTEGTGSIVIDGCVARRGNVITPSTGNPANFGFYGSSDDALSVTIKNCISLGHLNGFYYNNSSTVSASIYMLNNLAVSASAYGFAHTFYGTGDTVVLLNNMSVGNGSGSWYSETTGDVLDFRGYNAGTDETTIGTPAYHTQSFTFVNPSINDYRLSQSDMGSRAKGLDLTTASYGFTNDFLNQIRQTPWDIGPYETGIYEDIKTIKSSSGDYSSLSAWEAAQQRDLITSKSIAIAECYPFQDTTFVAIDGWVVDTAHPIIVRTPPPHRPRTTWDTDAYRLYITTPNNALDIAESDVIIDGLQIQGVYGTSYQRTALNITGQETGVVTIRNNNIVGDIVTYACNGIYYNKSISPGNQTVLVHNNVVSGWMNPDGTGGDAVGIYMNQYGFQHVFNNTIVSCSIGLRATSIASVISASNNLVYLCNTASFGTFDFASNNATDSSSIVGTNFRASQTFTFESGSYRLSTFDRGARTFGTNLSTIPTGSFTTDFDGNIRRRNWDIGAFQNNEQRIRIGSGETRSITGSGTTIFIDHFDRADGPIGNNYLVSSYIGGIYGTQSMIITDGRVRSAGPTGVYFSTVTASAQTFSNDHESTITYDTLSDFDLAGPLVRGNPVSGSGYVLSLDGEDFNNRRIQKMYTGSYVYIDGIGIGTVNIVIRAGDVMTLRAVGNTISAYKNGILVDSVVDTDYSTGTPGLFYNRGNTNGTYIDNLIVTDVNAQGNAGKLMLIV